MAFKKKPEEHAHAESWLVSYCDMISLLVTFFLMMMTFSTSAKYDVKEVGVGLMHGRGGIWKNSMTMPTENAVDMLQVNMLARDVAGIFDTPPGEQAPTVRSLVDGFSIGFDLESSFDPGSEELRPALRAELLRIAQILTHFPFIIVVEGYTDAQFKPSPLFRDDIAMGYARAREAAAILIESGLLTTDRVQIASFGQLRPRAQNDTPLSRQSNRRVELRVLPMTPSLAPSAAAAKGAR